MLKYLYFKFSFRYCKAFFSKKYKKKNGKNIRIKDPLNRI